MKFLWSLVFWSFPPLFLGFISLGVQADVKILIDEQAGLKQWHLTQGVMKLELVQQNPKAIKAFFIARDFSAPIATTISQNCVFQMILHNTGTGKKDATVELSLKAWQVKQVNDKEETKPIKLKEVWDKEWSEEVISKAARVAFRWATFPTEQTFEPMGDYAWGMVSIGLSPGESFDLLVKWKEDSALQEQWISNMQCPEEKSVSD